MAARATFALNVAEWFRRGRFMLSAPRRQRRLLEQSYHLSACPITRGHFCLHGACRNNNRYRQGISIAVGWRRGICSLDELRDLSSLNNGGVRCLAVTIPPNFSPDAEASLAVMRTVRFGGELLIIARHPLMDFMERYWWLVTAIVIGLASIGFCIYVARNQSPSKPGRIGGFLMFGPFWPVVDRYLSRRGGFTRREWVGWGVFLVIAVIAILFTGGNR